MARLVVANWKMNPTTTDEAAHLVSRVEHGMLGVSRKAVESVVCPPFLFLPAVRMYAHFTALGAQDIAPWSDADLTGEVSGEQLRNFGVRYVIVGHSERRELGESDKQIGQKVMLALRHRLWPILCVGYGVSKGASKSLRSRIILKQVENGFSQLKARDRASVIIAYEPVWAVGTGRPETPEAAAEVLSAVAERAPGCRLLYGGSVDGKKAGMFAAEPVISGVLVGGASLDGAEFVKIIKAFA